MPKKLSRSTAFCSAIFLTISLDASAQQSFFNVPAVETAPPGMLFAQAQGTFAAERGELNLTVDLGITHFLEVGVNVTHLPFYDRTTPPSVGPVDSAALFNTSLLARPTPWLRLTLGGQVGMAWKGVTSGAVPVAEGWGIARFELFDDRLRLLAGAYVGTESALGTGWPAGPMAGIEVVAVRHRLNFMADWLVGVNSASVAVAGLVVLLPAGTQLSAGAQIPSPFSGNSFGGVVEFTYVPQEPLAHPPTPPEATPPSALQNTTQSATH